MEQNMSFVELLGSLMRAIWERMASRATADQHRLTAHIEDLWRRIDSFPQDRITEEDRRKWGTIQRMIDHDENPVPTRNEVTRIPE